MALLNYIQSPFTAYKGISNIEKEPVIYMKAPKDTIEAAKNAFKADTSLAKRVYVRLELDRDLMIVFSDNQKNWSNGYFYYLFYRNCAGDDTNQYAASEPNG